MSSRRSRSSRQSGNSSSRISTEQQISELVSKLQTLLPAQQTLHNNINDTASASRVLQETCNYIRSLHKEVDDLSEKLSELLQNTDNNTDLAAFINSLLM